MHAAPTARCSGVGRRVPTETPLRPPVSASCPCRLPTRDCACCRSAWAPQSRGVTVSTYPRGLGAGAGLAPARVSPFPIAESGIFIIVIVIVVTVVTENGRGSCGSVRPGCQLQVPGARSLEALSWGEGGFLGGGVAPATDPFMEAGGGAWWGWPGVPAVTVAKGVLPVAALVLAVLAPDGGTGRAREVKIT